MTSQKYEDDAEWRRLMQITTAMDVQSGTLQFSPDEFTRPATEGAVAPPPEHIAQVRDALVASCTTGMFSFVSQWQGIAAQFKNANMRGTTLTAAEGIAAQFKNANMRGTTLTAAEVEACLAVISDGGSDALPPPLRAKGIKLVYYKGGMYGPDARTFKITRN
ncbi:hypothetical protein Pelo_5590 [Pelomyxa schiedti]|nr:hypothetical protein Pelo_5590 [Pelomyxa schiedti]